MIVTEDIFQFILYKVFTRHKYIIQKNQPNLNSAFFIKKIIKKIEYYDIKFRLNNGFIKNFFSKAN